MKQNATEKNLSFVCPMNFGEMPESANGRYCGKCSKEVFDLTNCSIDDVIALQKKHGSICGAVRATAVAATAAAAISLAACKTSEPEGPSIGTIAIEDHSVLAGMICAPEDLEASKGE